MAETVATLVAEIKADTRNFEDGLSSTQKGLKGFGASAGAAMAIATKAMDVAMDAAVGLAKSTVGAAVDWDRAFKNIEAVTKRSTATIQKQILNMKSAVAGPQELADAMYDIVGGVADASTHMAILEAANRTAEAGAANLKATTQGLISVMNSYKFSASQAAFASDVLTQVVNKGVGTMDQFVAAISPIAGLAASTGVKFDELGAAMAFMTTKGATAAQAGTQAQAAITALLKPNSQMNDLLKKVNVSTDNATAATGKMITTTKAGAADLNKYNDELAKTNARISDLSNKKKKSAMDQYNLNKLTAKAAELQSKVADGSQVVKYAQGAGTAQKVTAEWLIKTYGLVGALNKLKEAAGGSSQKMAEALGSVEALRAFVALTGGDFAEFEKDFKDGLSGATEAARQVQLQSVSAQFETFKHTLEGVAIAVGSVVLPALNGIFTFLNKGAEVVGKFGPIIQDGLAKIGGVFQPLLDEINRITKPITEAFGNIQLAFDKFFSDLFGDTTISAAGQRLSKKLGEVITPDKTLQEKIGPAFAALKAAIAEELGRIDFIGIATGLINAAATFGETLARNILLGLLDLGTRLISGLQAQFSGIDIGAAISTFLTNAQQTGMKFVDNLLSGLTDIVSKVGDAISGIDAVDIGSKAGKFLADALAFGGKIIGNLINGLLGIKSGVEGQVETQLNGVDLMSKAGTLIVKALQVGQQLIGKFMEGIASLGATLGNEIVKNLQSIDLGAAIQGLLTAAATNAQRLVGQFVGAIGALGHDFGTAIAANLQSIDLGAAATNLLNGASKIATDIINSAVSGIKGLADGLIKAISGELDKVIAGIQDKANAIGSAIASAITGKNVTIGGGGEAPAASGGSGGVSVGMQPGGGKLATGKQQRMVADAGGGKAGGGSIRDGENAAFDFIEGFQAIMERDAYKIGDAISAAFSGVTIDATAISAKLASMFSGADITTTLTNLGTTISTALATTFGPDGAVMLALKPFEASWSAMFGGAGTIATAAASMIAMVGELTAAIVNVPAVGVPALMDLEAASAAGAPTIVSSWQPVVAVFQELARSLDNVTGKARAAVAALGGVGTAGAGAAGARASGGPVKANSAYVVGENGPELFVPGANGQIIPNGGGGSAVSGGGAGGIIINGPINVYGATSAAQMYDQIRKEANRRNA